MNGNAEQYDGGKMSDTGFLTSKDGTRLFFQTSPQKGAKATVVVVHGFAEHSGRYKKFTTLLNQHGYNVLLFDFRGHGRSRGTRGYIDSISQYTDDLHAAICHASRIFGHKSVYCLSHSMGALVTTYYGVQFPSKLLGAVLSCPLFKISVEVPKWKSKAARIASTLTPKLALPNDLEPKYLTHDEGIVKQYEDDPLIFNFVRARWFWEILKSEQEVLTLADSFKVPFLLEVGEEDRVVCPEKAKLWYKKCKARDKTMLLYDGFYHEIYNEIDADRPISDALTWLDNQAKALA